MSASPVVYHSPNSENIAAAAAAATAEMEESTEPTRSSRQNASSSRDDDAAAANNNTGGLGAAASAVADAANAAAAAAEPTTEPDWVLQNYDPAVTEPQDVETELRRLQILKSFHMLDQPLQPCYTRFVQLAARLLRTPIAVMGLVDLGRVFNVAVHGLPPDLRECPRSMTVCAHAIQMKRPANSKHNVAEPTVMVVNDLSSDWRFVQNPAVKDLGLRFYASATLTTPEGYRLGTLCVMDMQPRPPLQHEEVRALQDLASCCMDLMLEHRQSLQAGVNNTRHGGGGGCAAAATGSTASSYSLDVQRSVSFLRHKLQHMADDVELQAVLDDHQRSTLRSAQHTCQFLYTSLVPTSSGNSSQLTMDNSGTNSRDSTTAGSAAGNGGSSSPHSFAASDPAAAANPNVPNDERTVGETLVVHLPKFVQSLEFVMESFPKQVPLLFDTHNLPERALLNDLKVFRSCIALLTSACERTTTGCIRFSVYAQPSSRRKDQELMFECEDSGPNVSLEAYPTLFQPPVDNAEDDAREDNDVRLLPPYDDIGDESCIQVDSAGAIVQGARRCYDARGSGSPTVRESSSHGFAVHAVSEYIGSLGGDYGFRPRSDSHGNAAAAARSSTTTGSIFWFSLPLRLPQNFAESTANPEPGDTERVVQKSLPNLYKFENIAMPSWS